MTRGEAIKDFFYKTILPVAAAALLYCIFRSACVKNGELDYDNLTKMAQQSDFQKGYIYSLLSDKVHMNALGAFHYLDNSEPGIPLGDVDGGKQQPLWYTSLFLYCSAGIIYDHYPEMCPQSVIDLLKQFSIEASRKMKQ